jgi:AcrR family transcriptional regulator
LGTSTRESARQAEVSKRELYAIFGSKQGILAAMIEGRAAWIGQQGPSYIFAALIFTYGTTVLHGSRAGQVAVRRAESHVTPRPDSEAVLKAQSRAQRATSE